MELHSIGNEPRRLTRGGGFTLLEVIMVMLLLAILSGVTVVTLTRTNANRSRIAAQQLHRDLTFARQRAMATGLGVWVVFHTGNETWTILEEDPLAPGRAGATVITDPATNADFVYTLGTGAFVGVQIVSVNFDEPPGPATVGLEIGFNWIGEPLNDAELDLTAQGIVTLSNSHVVTVEIETGYVAYAPP